MNARSWTDEWFRRSMPALLVAFVATFAAWVAAGERTPTSNGSIVPREPRPEPTDRTRQRPALPTRVDETRGRVGPIRLGMRIVEVRGAFGADGVLVVQRPSGTSRSFELFVPRAGLKIRGSRDSVHTITITNSGLGPRFITRKRVKIGTSDLLLTRRYPSARLVCGRQWWVGRASTLRFTTQHRHVVAITLSSQRRTPLIVDCY